MFVETKREGEAPVVSPAKEMLIAARAKIAKAENWCQGAQGMTKDGYYCHPCDSRAVRHCALGAISAVIGEYVGYNNPARMALSRVIPGASIGPWNNCHAHAEVIAAFDCAIACS